MKKWLIITSMILLSVTMLVGCSDANKEEKTMFPIDTARLNNISVRHPLYIDVKTSYFNEFSDDEKAVLADALNQLQLVKEDREFSRNCPELSTAKVLYEIDVVYAPEKYSNKMGEGSGTIFVLENNRLITLTDGYEYYDDSSSYYDELLNLLEQYQKICFQKIILLDGTVITDADEFEQYQQQLK